MATTPQQLLSTAGLRVTAQRATVLAEIMREGNDITASALHARLRVDHPNLGLATVYRTLGTLRSAGIIDALPHGDSLCYRYCAPGHHHHLTCRKCHKVVEIRECDLDRWASAAAAAHGFRDASHVVELSGLCEAC